MTIKQRLRLSYVAMLCIPPTLMVFAGMTISEMMDFDGGLGVVKDRNPMERILNISHKVTGIVNNQILENPDQLADPVFIAKLDKEMSIAHGGIIVRKDSQIIYAPNFIAARKDHIKLIPFKSEATEEWSSIDSQEKLVIMRLQDFYYTNGSEGSIFLSIDTAAFNQSLEGLRKMYFTLSVLILFTTNGVLTVLVYRSIMKPLQKLKKASNEIREGNLDYIIENTFHDEFGEVIESFEEMRKKLKASLIHQQKYEENRRILISNISHDLKTPITCIKGYIEGIKDGVPDTPEKMNKYIDTIYKKATDMDNLIDDLFLLSKLELQKITFDFAEFDFRSYMQDIGEELSFDIEREGAELSLILPEHKLMVYGDGNNIRRVITNIVDNSIKYANPNQRPIKILITVGETENEVIVEVKDNGRGINPEDLPHVLDLFYRADPSRNMNRPGSGLGLAIVKRIVEEHGGRVWITSKVEKGTSVFFTLRKNGEEKKS